MCNNKLAIVLQGPFFQRPDIDIPEDLYALMDDSEDQELFEFAAEADTSSNCDKCRESTAKEKKLVLKLKALQKSQRLLQKLNKDKAVELEHCRELLKEVVKESTTKTMQSQNSTETVTSEKEESMEIEGGVPCSLCSYVARSMKELQSHFKTHHNLNVQNVI